MKRLIAILLVMMMVFTFAACGGDDEAVSDADQNEASQEDQNTEDGASDEEPADEETSAEETASETKENMIDPADAPEDESAPPTGDDKSIRGVPELIDVLAYDDGDLMVLVNKYHGTVPDYEPIDMVPVDPALATWNDLEMKKEAYDAYLEMYEDAKEQGFDLKICSAYRSYETQKGLYNNALASYDPEFAHMYSSYPGRSEHHTGLAIDITSASMDWGLRQDFADFPDGQWLDEHCQDYGFILRYLKGAEDITGYMYEPWHFRYVGKEAAKEIMEKGITFEEYLGKE